MTADVRDTLADIEHRLREDFQVILVNDGDRSVGDGYLTSPTDCVSVTDAARFAETLAAGHVSQAEATAREQAAVKKALAPIREAFNRSQHEHYWATNLLQVIAAALLESPSVVPSQDPTENGPRP